MSSETDDLVSWTLREFGTTWQVSGDFPLQLGLAMRRNPRRAQLIVSPALAKHVPISPTVLRSAARELAQRLAPVTRRAERPLCIGLAETATALALAVAAELDLDVMHSTRGNLSGHAAVHSFSERHSHAPAHWLTPHAPEWLRERDLVVIVDDELSTGDTVRELMQVLQELNPRARFVVAALVDARPERDDLQVYALVRLRFTAPHGAIDVATRWAELTDPRSVGELERRRPAISVDAPRPAAIPSRGLCAGDRHLHDAATRLGGHVRARLPEGGRVHVLGMEEQIYVPLLIAEHLAAAGVSATVSSTTRSPIVVVDHSGYPVRSRVTYGGVDAPRFAYNLPVAPAMVVVVPDFATPRAEVDSLLASIRNSAMVVTWI